jgi:hypothetical protein
MLHPLRWTGVLAMLWPVLSILIIYFTNVNINFDGFALFVMLPPAILIGLNGFYMIQRDEYIQHAGGNIAYGFPAKLLGYFFVIFGWGGTIYLITGIVFHWF